MSSLHLTRRSALLGLTASYTLGRASLALASPRAHAPTSRRFVVIILRGALDGMAAIVPYGDPNLALWRPNLIPAAIGSANGMLDLGGFYGLHPALADLYPLYQAGDLLPVHATAGHYRSRSHFEAQDYMESGADHLMTSGWLNRVVQVLPFTQRADAAFSVGTSMPLLLRGPAPVGSYAPMGGARPSPDLYARIAALNAPDPIMGPAIEQALQSRGMTSAILTAASDANAPPPKNANGFPALAATCGTLLAASDGPRIAALEIGGWDTHVAQMGRLGGPLKDLAAGIAALKHQLGDAWKDTTVLAMTEFGRTVRQNGTQGTDHGTGTVAFIAGGNIAGGRVGGTWPGLAQTNLFENRDLFPTTDLRSLAKGLLAAQYGLHGAQLDLVFPDSADAGPARGLLRRV